MPARSSRLIFCGALVAAATFGFSKPQAVSPGSLAGSVIGDPCPTFSWVEVEGARFYELVVYRHGESGESIEAVLSQRIPGPALSWTPPLESCLNRGSHYAWAVRASSPDRDGDWSMAFAF